MILVSTTELLCITKHPLTNTRLQLYYLGWDKLGYVFYWKDKWLFDGLEYKPSPLYNIDSIECALSLMAWLTTRPGDTDNQFFDRYTAEQMEWTQSTECEQLSLLVSDAEDIGGQYQSIALSGFQHDTYGYGRLVKG